MFVCTKCLDGHEGPAVEVAKALGPRSLGNCELCDKGQRLCYDIPSSAAWWPKKKVGERRKAK